MEKVSLSGLDVGLHPGLSAISRLRRRALERVGAFVAAIITVVVNLVLDGIGHELDVVEFHPGSGFLSFPGVGLVLAAARQNIGLDPWPLSLTLRRRGDKRPAGGGSQKWIFDLVDFVDELRLVEGCLWRVIKYREQRGRLEK